MSKWSQSKGIVLTLSLFLLAVQDHHMHGRPSQRDETEISHVLASPHIITSFGDKLFSPNLYISPRLLII